MNGLDRKGLDLDALRGRWKESQQPLNNALILDREAISNALAGRTARAFRRHSLWLLPHILLAAAAFAGLLWLTLNHVHGPFYLLTGGVLSVIAAAELIVSGWQWRVLSALDFSQPAMLVQTTLERLRARRLRLTQWIMLSSVLLWLPAIAFLLQALLGVDLLRQLDESVLPINLLVGVLFIPVAMVIGRWVLNRFVGEAGKQHFFDDAVGLSWTRAQREWQRQQAGEQALDQGSNPLATPQPLPASVSAALRVLQRRLLLGIFVFAGLILGNGMFITAHGEQWQFLVPGIVLNLLCVSQMVQRILQRLQLKRMDGGMSAHELQQHLEDAAAMGEQVARVTLILAPVLFLLLAQTLAQLCVATDVFNRLGLPISLLMGGVAGAISIGLWRAANRDPAAFFPRLVAAIAGGATRAMRTLRAGMPAAT